MEPTTNKMPKGSRGSSARSSASPSEPMPLPEAAVDTVSDEKFPKPEIPEFTATEVLDEVTPGDNTLNIVGYVDAILGSEIVGKERKLGPFKFVLNNDDGTRITVLIWEDEIQTYERLVIYHELSVSTNILELQNVKALPLDPIFNPRKEGFANFGLSVQRTTKLILHGVWNSVSSKIVPIPTIPIKYAAAYNGSSVVEGYISADFVRVTTGSDGCSYATGAISDGAYKLRVQVANFTPSTETTLGTNIKITGTLKEDKFGTVYLQTENVSSIVKLSDDKFDRIQLKKNCFRAPLKILPPV